MRINDDKNRNIVARPSTARDATFTVYRNRAIMVCVAKYKSDGQFKLKKKIEMI